MREFQAFLKKIMEYEYVPKKKKKSKKRATKQAKKTKRRLLSSP